MGEITLRMDGQTVLLAVLVVFGLIGVQRGVRRELYAMVGIGLAMFVSQPLARLLAPRLDTLARVGRLLLRDGGAAEPAVVALAQSPADAGGDVQRLALIVFGGIVFGAYLVGQLRLPRPGQLMPRLLGALAGAINGFLLAYHLFPALLQRSEATGTLSTAATGDTLADGRTVAMVALFIVVVLIAFGLYSARGSHDAGGRDGPGG